MPDTPPPTPDEVTDPAIRGMDPLPQIQAAVLLLLDGQREVVPAARDALRAVREREVAAARLRSAVVEYLRSRYGAPSTAIVAVLLTLALVSRLGGIRVDLGDLAAAGVDAWQGCPTIVGPPAPAPASASDAPEAGPTDGPL